MLLGLMSVLTVQLETRHILLSEVRRTTYRRSATGGLELEAAGEIMIPLIMNQGGAMPVVLLCQVPVVANTAQTGPS